MSWSQILSWGSAVAYGIAYLGGVATLGYLTHNEFAWKLAVAAMGICFLTFALQAVEPDWKYVSWRLVAGTSAACSIVAGVLAGLGLLVR